MQLSQISIHFSPIHTVWIGPYHCTTMRESCSCMRNYPNSKFSGGRPTHYPLVEGQNQDSKLGGEVLCSKILKKENRISILEVDKVALLVLIIICIFSSEKKNLIIGFYNKEFCKSIDTS